MSSKEEKNKKKAEELETDADDVFFEEEQEERSSFSSSSKKDKEKLKKAIEEKQEYLLGWQRAKADLINYKKDEEKRMESIRKYSNEDLIKEILPVLDSFEEARKSDSWKEADGAWKDGMTNTINQLEKALQKFGLEEITETGEFDPNIHESVEMINKCSEEDDGKIDEIIQKGYKLNGRVLRPAKVRVKVFRG